MAKDRYEISLWEDYVEPQDLIRDIPAHFEERKIAVIGSDTMTSECRAIEPKLVENINGTNTFTFKMFYVYKNENNETYQNPFLNLLVNERKVKVLWKNKWYDLVIKNCQEDSSGKSITYTCKDLFVNELSKTGFDLVLDADLGNNQGTVTELAATILEGTDWAVSTDGNDIIQQEKEEPVYEVKTLKQDNFINQTTGESGVAIPSNANVLVYYQQVQDFLSVHSSAGESARVNIQFAYTPAYQVENNSQLVINADCYTYMSGGGEGQLWTLVTLEGEPAIQLGGVGQNSPWGYIRYNNGVSDRYRARRLVRSQVCELDPLTGKYCDVYVATSSGPGIEENNIIYGYKSIEYKDPTFVNNILVNSKDFSSTDGWIGDNLSYQLYPLYNDVIDIANYNSRSYLHLITTSNNDWKLNNGLRELSSFIPDGFVKGEKYIFRAIMRSNTTVDGNAVPGAYVSNYEMHPQVTQYDNNFKPTGNSYFSVDANSRNVVPVSANPSQDGYWVEYTLTCEKTVTRSQIYSEKVALFIRPTTQSTSSGNYWLQEVQFFPLCYGLDGQNSTRIEPGKMDTQSVATTYYTYYNHTKSSALLNADDIELLYRGTVDSDLGGCIVPKYNDNFVKIRSITAKQSNRFNLLQTLAETFECWVQFNIKHDQATGRTEYENGVPQKTVVFKKEIGQETGVGFIYGIDLKTIQRTIQSDQIVTKTIVSANSNEFGTDGFCTIARSIENYPRTNFILNFDYYITQGLMSGGELNKDLYLSTGEIGYYYNLNKWNLEYDNLSELISKKTTELSKQKAYLQVYDATITSLEEQINNIKNELTRLASSDTFSNATSYIKANAEHKQVKDRVTNIQILESQLKSYQAMRDSLQSSITQLTDSIKDWVEEREDILNNIKAKHLQFYKKYSRYIQEGSWISEDYMDDNLYYLDALSVAYTSSRPQISYNISVLRLSALEEFKNKVFHLGDISFIQDTEFFGYVYVNTSTYQRLPTPYKEKVLVSEVTSNFDEPEKDQFKVQNYKTQFEDLFQRITSTTQSLQYSSGEYARAASIVDTNGTIDARTLQSSIALNEQLVYSARNESVINDSTGITVSDTTNPNKKTKITSGGVFITTDGGATWINAIQGEGISTQQLSAGMVTTNIINIVDGQFSTFRWDEDGINAYNVTQDNLIDLNQFVRFDHFGIYGYTGDGSGTPFIPESQDQIWERAKFGLTWEGLFIKNIYGNHYVEVSNKNDIQVVDATDSEAPIAKVKIGHLGNSVYGMRLMDDSGNITMETANDGTLWLKNALNISSSSYNVSVGALGVATSTAFRPVPQVFNANNNFIVYEDGVMSATGGIFDGTIYARAGQIGNMTIEEVEQATYKVVIDSSNGTIFKNGDVSTTLTARLLQGNTEILTGITYQWYMDGTQMTGQTSRTLNITSSSFEQEDVHTYTCKVIMT